MKYVRPFFAFPLILCGKMNACNREDLFWSFHAFPHPHTTLFHTTAPLFTYTHIFPRTYPHLLQIFPHISLPSPTLSGTLPHSPHSIYLLSPSPFTTLHTSSHHCTFSPSSFRISSTPPYTPHTSSHISPYFPPLPTSLPRFPSPLPIPYFPPHFSPHLPSRPHLLLHFSTPPKPLFTFSPTLLHTSPTPLFTYPTSQHTSPHLSSPSPHNSTHLHSHFLPPAPTPQHTSPLLSQFPYTSTHPPHLSPPFAYLSICFKLPIFPNVHLSQCSLVPKRPFAPKCFFLQMSICPSPHTPHALNAHSSHIPIGPKVLICFKCPFVPIPTCS